MIGHQPDIDRLHETRHILRRLLTEEDHAIAQTQTRNTLFESRARITVTNNREGQVGVRVHRPKVSQSLNNRVNTETLGNGAQIPKP